VGKITAREFEAKVFETEDVVVRLRCPHDQTVEDYNFLRKAAGNTSMTDWLESRVNPRIGDIDCDILEGSTYQRPHGRTNMDTLRRSYVKNK